VATPGLEAEVFALLQQIDATGFMNAGRVYGGGLNKMEPKELAAIPAGPILEFLQAQRWRLGAEFDHPDHGSLYRHDRRV
jgi:hypothetical protein